MHMHSDDLTHHYEKHQLAIVYGINAVYSLGTTAQDLHQARGLLAHPRSQAADPPDDLGFAPPAATQVADRVHVHRRQGPRLLCPEYGCPPSPEPPGLG